MCNYSFLKIGDNCQITQEKEGYCDNCGGPFFEVGAYYEAIYMGHINHKRYGLCDQFKLKIPATCRSCGATVRWTFLPCGGISSGLFEQRQYEYVEVEREGNIRK